uniref:SHSP domain-containing protein n=1 Tax=Globodera pallida TaxID=36090 RepID=A0A183C6I6_GLOPA
MSIKTQFFCSVDHCILSVYVSGFRPEEITVELKDNEIIVEGEHREQNQGESVHCQVLSPCVHSKRHPKGEHQVRAARGPLVQTGSAPFPLW